MLCLLHRVAEDTWPCKMNQITADPEGKWHRLARKETDQQTVDRWVVKYD
jgi:hypothetical protein